MSNKEVDVHSGEEHVHVTANVTSSNDAMRKVSNCKAVFSGATIIHVHVHLHAGKQALQLLHIHCNPHNLNLNYQEFNFLLNLPCLVQ